MNILIADSGGTKTNWVLIHSTQKQYFKGSGLHPAYNTVEQISEEIKATVSAGPHEIDTIFFYGAGCHGKTAIEKIKSAFKLSLPGCALHIYDDLTGAARAHLQTENGIIAALGTGSICGRYERGKIINRSPALGYAIGDEGSAVDLGKSVLRAFFRKEFDPETDQIIRQKLNNDDYSYWMNKIYENTKPNRELASVAGTVFKGELSKQLNKLLIDCFERFLDSQLSFLKPEQDEPIIFTGTVSNAHAKIILSLLKKREFTKTSVKEGLIEGLATYHVVPRSQLND